MARVRVESGEQCPGAVALVLELATASPASRRRLERVPVLERLHSRLLVDAKHGVASCRRRDVKIADYTHLRPEFGIRTVQPETDVMRTNLLEREDAANLGLAQDEAGCSRQRGPKRVESPHASERQLAVCWAFARELDQLQPDEHGHRRRAARAPRVLERVELRPRPESLLPLANRALPATKCPRDRRVALTAPTEQHDLSALNQPRRAPPRPHDRLQLPASRCSQLERRGEDTWQSVQSDGPRPDGFNRFIPSRTSGAKY